MNGEKYIRFDKRRGTYSVRISGYGKGKEVFNSPAKDFDDAIRIRNEFLINTYGNLDFLSKLRYPEKIKGNRYVLSDDGTYYKVYTANEKYCFLIDSDDYDRVSKITWYKLGKYISSRNHGQLHRFLLFATDRKYEVDHINLDTFDNRKKNLRKATHRENCYNRRKRIDKKSSKYKGVFFISKTGKYYAELKCEDGIFRSKPYEKEKDAAIAYNKMAEEHHGKYANSNLIQD